MLSASKHGSLGCECSYQVIQDLIANDSAHLEALLARYRVDDHIAMYTNEVLAVEYSILILASGINDLDREVLISISNDFAEGVLDGRVVGVDEVAVHKLHCKRALPCHMRKQSMPGVSSCAISKHTDGPAAYYGHLALLLLWRHGVRSGALCWYTGCNS